MTLARGARQLVVQEALLTKPTDVVSITLLQIQFPTQLIEFPHLNLNRTTKTFGVSGELPDDGHGGGVVFVLVYSHDEHGGVG